MPENTHLIHCVLPFPGKDKVDGGAGENDEVFDDVIQVEPGAKDDDDVADLDRQVAPEPGEAQEEEEEGAAGDAQNASKKRPALQRRHTMTDAATFTQWLKSIFTMSGEEE